MSSNKTDQRKRGSNSEAITSLPFQQVSGLKTIYIYALKVEATKLKPCKTRNNLSQRQRVALRKLRKRKDINIKKADKGSTVVIQDRQEYIDTGLEHLSDKIHTVSFRKTRLNR